MASDNLEDQSNKNCSSVRLFAVCVVAIVNKNISGLLSRMDFSKVLDERVRQHCLATTRVACQPKESITASFKPRNEQTVAADPLTGA